MSEKRICAKCTVERVPKTINLNYLGHSLTNDFPCCPVCGQPYIPPDIVSGKMHEVETLLEDK